MNDRGNDLALTRMDQRVHRCGDCGAWCYSTRPCTTCQPAEREDADAA